jgi:3-hydroxyacyl-CoA dehydrogenase
MEINKASVIGAGTMGGGIAMCFANAGIPVRVYDNSVENLGRGIKVINGNYQRTMQRGRLTQAQVDERMALITPTPEFDDLGDADIVIEAVYENLDLKKEIFQRLEKIMPKGALLATNTSGLDVDAVAAVTSRPEDVCACTFLAQPMSCDCWKLCVVKNHPRRPLAQQWPLASGWVRSRLWPETVRALLVTE